MNVYIKLIDRPTGQVVRPMDSRFSDRWPKIHDISNNEWSHYSRFVDDYYLFSGSYSANSGQRYEIYHPRYPKQEIPISIFQSTRFNGRSGNMNHHIFRNRIEFQLIPHHLISVNGRDRFIFGANLAWLDGKYGHDLKRPLSEESRQNITEYFNKMSNLFNCHIVRVWVFEACEGLTFNSGRVEMESEMENSIRFIQRIAHQQNLSIYWCLLSSHPQHNREAFQRDIEIIRSASSPQDCSFLNSALHYFIDALRQQPNVNNFPNVFAIDVMNEPEKYISEGGLTWNDIQNFIGASCNAIKNYSGNKLLVSCGSTGGGWVNDSLENTIVKYKELGLDFYDYHKYDNAGLEKTFDQLNLDKPCIIGEFGQDKNSSWNDDLQVRVANNFIEQSWHLGYAGCLIWHYNFKNFKKFYYHHHYSKSDTLLKNRASLIYDNGSPRPVRETMEQFNNDYYCYTSI